MGNPWFERLLKNRDCTSFHRGIMSDAACRVFLDVNLL